MRMLHGIDQQRMAQMNRMAALRLILKRGKASRADMADSLGLTPTSLTRISSDFIESGIALDGPVSSGKRGRPSTFMRLNPDWAHVIVLSVTNTLSMGVVNLEGRLIREEQLCRVPQTYSANYRDSLKSIPGALARLIREEKAERRLLGVGVICSGVVHRNGKVMNTRLSEREVDLVGLVRRASDLPVMVGEEFRLLLCAQVWKQERPWQTAVAMTAGMFGYGGGLGCMVNGQIFDGLHGMAGQPGYSAPVLYGYEETRRWEEQVHRMGGQAAYFEAVTKGKPAAMRIHRKAVENYAYRVAQIANYFDPEVILIYDPYVAIAGRFLKDMRASLAQYTHPSILADLRVEFGGGRKSDEELVAAGSHVLSHFFAEGELSGAGLAEESARAGWGVRAAMPWCAASSEKEARRASACRVGA